MKIEIEKSGEYPDIKVLFDAFPQLSARILGYIGRQAAEQLYAEHLQGQDITYHTARRSSSGVPLGESGRRLVSYSVGRGLKWVAVSSFPLNLYEKRRRIRTGKITGTDDKPRTSDVTRKGILTRKFASGLSGRLANYISEAENLIVDDWFNGNKKGGMRALA